MSTAPGVRYTLYDYAHRHNGFYNREDGVSVVQTDENNNTWKSVTASNTIFYGADKIGLQFHILFSDETSANAFERVVRESWRCPRGENQAVIYAETSVQKFTLTKPDFDRLVRIKTWDYNRRDADSNRPVSPNGSAAGQSDAVSTAELIQPIFIYQGLEAASSFVGDIPELAHIIPNSELSKLGRVEGYEDDAENNRFALSGRLHKFFDGRALRPRMPLCLIHFVEATGQTEASTVEGRNRYAVRIEITFFKDANGINARDTFTWRENSVRRGEDKLEMTLFVLDVERFRFYLDYREKLTKHEREMKGDDGQRFLHPNIGLLKRPLTRGTNQEMDVDE